MQIKHVFLALMLIFGLASSPYVYSQKAETAPYKSLKKRALSRRQDELLDDASLLKEKDPREALNKVQEALGLSIAGGDVLKEGKCYIILGEINESIEEWKLALENFNNAYKKLKPTYNTSPEFKNALRGLADTHLKLRHYDNALQLYNEGLKLRLSSSEREQAQLGISEVYYQMENYTDALKALENIPSIKISDEAFEATVQNQKAKIYARMNEVDKATDALISSQNTLRSRALAPQQKGAVLQKEDASLQNAKEEVAGVLHEQKRYDQEIDLRNKSIEYNLDNNNLREVTKDKVGKSKALEAKGETSAAIRELEEAVVIADTIDNPKNRAKAFLALADLYEKNGRNTQALSAYKKYSESVSKTEQETENRLTEKSELIKKQRDIEEYTKQVEIGQREDTIAKATVFRQQLIIYGLVIIILIVAVTSYFIYKNAQASKVANQLLALKSLRSQMNPHFIFNALNSVNHFVSQNDERTANKFLSEFSRLMRLVLENSQEDFIPLYKEQEIISLYLKLEHYRFRDKFEYEVKIDADINPESIDIPPMLLQPYIENAVWHGLRYKEDKGHLALHMRKRNHGLEIEITDDGIGRKRSTEVKTSHQQKQHSTGLKNIEERLLIINKVYHTHYRVDIKDLDTATGKGTRVVITLPAHKQNGKA
jgi:tetratricopeptide (TPR) repeat protein